MTLERIIDICKAYSALGDDELLEACGAPDDPEVIAECVMDADRLTSALRRSKHTSLADKVEIHILTKELEDTVKRAFM